MAEDLRQPLGQEARRELAQVPAIERVLVLQQH